MSLEYNNLDENQEGLITPEDDTQDETKQKKRKPIDFSTDADIEKPAKQKPPIDFSSDTDIYSEKDKPVYKIPVKQQKIQVQKKIQVPKIEAQRDYSISGQLRGLAQQRIKEGGAVTDSDAQGLAYKWNTTIGDDGSFGRPQEGYNKTRVNSLFESAGLSQGDITPDELGNAVTNTVVDITDYAGKTGKEFQADVVKRLVNLRTPEPDVADVVSKVFLDIKGDNAFVGYNQEKDGSITEKPLFSVDEVKQFGDSVEEGGRVFTNYQDKNNEIVRMISTANILKKAGKLSEQELRTGYDKVRDFFNKENKEFDEKIAYYTERLTKDGKLDFADSMSVMGELAFGTLARFTKGSAERRELIKSLVGEEEANKINDEEYTYDPYRNDAYVNTKEMDTRFQKDIDSMWLANYGSKGAKLDELIMRVQREKGNNYILNSIVKHPTAILTMKTLGVSQETFNNILDPNKQGVSDEMIGSQIMQLIPALLPAIGVPYNLAQVNAQTLTAPDSQRYGTMAVTLATMGFSKFFSNPITRGILGNTKTAVAGAVTNVAGATAITGLNIDTYKNADGSIRYLEMITNNVMDIAQLGGRDIPEFVKSVKNRNTPESITGIFFKDVDTGKLYVLGKDELGNTRVFNSDQSQLDKVKTLAEDQKVAYLVQNINARGLKLLKGLDTTFTQRVQKALFGKDAQVVERIGNDKITINGVEHPLIDAESAPKGVPTNNLAWQWMDIFTDDASPTLNIKEIKAMPDSIASLNRLKDDGFINIDKDGNISATKRGTMEFQRAKDTSMKLYEEAQKLSEEMNLVSKPKVEYTQEEMLKMESDLEEAGYSIDQINSLTTDERAYAIKNKVPASRAKELELAVWAEGLPKSIDPEVVKNNRFINKYQRSVESAPIDITPADLMAMGAMEREAVKYGLATGKLEMNGEGGVTNRPYIVKSHINPDMTLVFGKDVESHKNFIQFQIGEAEKSKNNQTATKLAEKYKRLYGKDDDTIESIIDEAKIKYPNFEQQIVKGKETGFKTLEVKNPIYRTEEPVIGSEESLPVEGEVTPEIVASKPDNRALIEKVNGKPNEPDIVFVEDNYGKKYNLIKSKQGLWKREGTNEGYSSDFIQEQIAKGELKVVGRVPDSWNVERQRTKVEYKKQSGAVKANLIPETLTREEASQIYGEEGDLFNIALFNQTAGTWRQANPDKAGNMRDYATVEQLAVLKDLEKLNNQWINEGMPTVDRILKMNSEAQRLMREYAPEGKPAKFMDEAKISKNLADSEVSAIAKLFGSDAPEKISKYKELTKAIRSEDNDTTFKILQELTGDSFDKKKARVGLVYKQVKDIMESTDFAMQENNVAESILKPLGIDNPVKTKNPMEEVQNSLNYKAKVGEVTTSSGHKIQIDDEKWSGKTGDYFEVNDSNEVKIIYANEPLFTKLKLNRGYKLESGLFGVTLENGKKAGNRLSILASTRIKGEFEKFVDEVGKSTDPVVVVLVNPDKVPYREFSSVENHEMVHSIIVKKNGGMTVIQNPDTHSNIWNSKDGQVVREAVQNSPYRGKPMDAVSHEVLAFATNKDTVNNLGIKTPEQLDAFIGVYDKLLRAMTLEQGEDFTKHITNLTDDRILEAVNKLRENENRITENRQTTDTRRYRVSENAQSRGISPEDAGTAKWEGSGVKRVGLRRLTRTGNPLDLTGVGGAEKSRLVKQGAEPPINFYVKKPDGTFSIENDFKTPSMIPFDVEVVVNLADIYTDKEAREKLLNSTYPEFQKWAESKGYDGVINSNPDVADAFRYRVQLFRNKSNIDLISSSDSDFGAISTAISRALKNNKKWQEWGGNTEAKDEEGNPLILLHGTKKKADFDKPDPLINPSQLGTHLGTLEQSHFFTYNHLTILGGARYSFNHRMKGIESSPFVHLFSKGVQDFFGHRENYYDALKYKYTHLSEVPKDPNYQLKLDQLESFEKHLEDITRIFGTFEKFLGNVYADPNFNKGQEYFSSRSRVYPLLINVENPVILQDSGGWDAVTISRQLKDSGIITPYRFSTFRDDLFDIEMSLDSDNPRNQEIAERNLLVDLIEEQGYDGAKYLNKVEGKGWSYIVFHDEQMKSPYDPDFAMMGLEDEDTKTDLKMKSIYDTKPEELTKTDFNEILKKGNFSAITADDLESLRKDLNSIGVKVLDSDGVYKGQSEKSLVAYYPTEDYSRLIQALGKKYNQESVLHASGGKYTIEYTDGRKMESTSLVKDSEEGQDGTYIKLKSGEVRFSAEFDWNSEPIPAPEGYDLTSAEKRIESINKAKDTSILNPSEVRDLWNGTIPIEDADGNVRDVNAVHDLNGKPVGTAKLNKYGVWTAYVYGKEIPVIDNIAFDGENAYPLMNRGDSTHSLALLQELSSFKDGDDVEEYTRKTIQSALQGFDGIVDKESILKNTEANPLIVSKYFKTLVKQAVKVERNEDGSVVKLIDSSIPMLKDVEFLAKLIGVETAKFNNETGSKFKAEDTAKILTHKASTIFRSLHETVASNPDLTHIYTGIKNQIDNNNADDINDVVIDYTDDGFSFAMAQANPLSVQNAKIDKSDPLLASGDYDAWLTVANRLAGAVTDGEAIKIQKLLKSGDIDGTEKFILGLNKMTPFELLVNLGRVAMLIGFRNFSKNTVGNSLKQFMDEISKLPASVMDLAFVELNKMLGGKNNDRAGITSVATNPITNMRAMKEGLVRFWSKGIQDSIDTVRGKSVTNFEHPSFSRQRTTGYRILAPFEFAERVGWRIQGAFDKPFVASAYARAITEIQGVRQKEQIDAGNKISYKQAEDYLTPADYELAENLALNAVFQGSNKVASRYYEAIDDLPPTWRAISNSIFKFVKTPLNVVDYVMDYTGIWQLAKLANKNRNFDEYGGFKNTVKKILDTPEDRKVLSMAISQGMIGTAMMHIGFKMAEAGLITPFYKEKDKKEREQMESKNTSYGSVNFNGYNLDISWITPNSFYLLAGASIYDERKNYNQKIIEAEEKFANLQNDETSTITEMSNAEKALNKLKASSPNEKILSTIMKNLALQTPFFRQGIDAYEAIDNGKGVTGIITNWVSADQFVPAIVKEIAETMDTTSRLIRDDSILNTQIDKVKSKIPVARESLPANVDMLGKEVQTGYGLDPLKTEKISTDPLVNDLDRFNITISNNSQGNKIDKNEFAKDKGDFVRPHLEKLVGSEVYKNSSDEVKKEILTDAVYYLNKVNSKRPAKEFIDFKLDKISDENKTIDELKTNGLKFSQEKVTDEKTIRNIIRAGINPKDLTVDAMKNRFSSEDEFERFIHSIYTVNFSPNEQTTFNEAKAEYEEFKKDKGKYILNKFVNDLEYENRQKRIADWREELEKKGLSKEEIAKEIRSRSSKLGKQMGYKYRITKEIIIPKTMKQTMIEKLTPSKNIEDRR